MAEHPSFGEWLRKKRRDLDFSRQELAEQVGCAEITLRRIEGGSLKPSKDLAAVLLEKVGIPKSELGSWVQYARGFAGLPLQEIKTVENQIKTNLPAALTSFIGRENELNDITGLLAKHRLVTLVGTGGVGKTRLSIKVSEQQILMFSDGIWLVELAPIVDPQIIPQIIASILGIPVSAPQPVTETIFNFLRAKTALLIFDNCEHLLDAVALLADNLLKQCPHLKILATSREGMGIMGEATYIVPTMSLPNADQILDTFRDFSSVRLFEERAQLAKFDFSLTMENASFVAQICSRLNGIPLALELAAVQVSQFSPEEIAKQLDDSFLILTGGSRTALPRQQTLRASIDWSWNLLTDNERTLLRRLSVFAGGWTLESARAVCSGDVPRLINALVKKSLVVMNQDSGSEKRYGFHEVIRQYAREKLVEADEDEIHRQKHLYYYVSLAEHADIQLHGVDQNPWFERLVNELPNARAALEFAFDHDIDQAVRLSGALGWFWYRRGLLVEGRRWYEKILAKQPPTDHESYIKAFYGAGLVSHFQGDYDYARKMLGQSLTLAQRQEEPDGVARSQTLLGMGYVWQGDFAKADQYFRLSIEVFKVTNVGWGHAFALNALGFSCLMRGDFAKAQSCFEESLLLARTAGDKYGMGMPLSNLGSMAYQQGDLVRGKELLEESLAVGREVHDPTVTFWAMKELGHVAYYQGDYARATELYEAVLEECRVTGYASGVVEMLRSLGDVAIKTGAHQKARFFIHDSLGLSQDLGDIRNIIFCMYSFATLAGASSNWLLAVKLLGVVDAQLKKMGISMPPVEKITFEQMTASAKQEIHEVIFQQIWTEGESISLSGNLGDMLKPLYV